MPIPLGFRNISLYWYDWIFTTLLASCILAARRNTMAYAVTRNVLKSGDTIYYINTVSRIPGEKSKRKTVMVEKYSANSLRSLGEQDPEAYVNRRADELREMSRKVVRTMN